MNCDASVINMDLKETQNPLMLQSVNVNKRKCMKCNNGRIASMTRVSIQIGGRNVQN